VILVAGQSPLDELCTGVLAQQLAQDGFRPEVMTAAEIASAQLQGREFAGVKLVCLVMLNVERRGPYLKLIARRLRRLFPEVKRVGGFWGGEKGKARVPEMFPDLDLQPVTASLDETLTLCRTLARQAQTGATG
jgi:hypothetical protein